MPKQELSLSRMMIFTKAKPLRESANTRTKKEDELQKEFLIIAYLLSYFGIGFWLWFLRWNLVLQVNDEGPEDCFV